MPAKSRSRGLRVVSLGTHTARLTPWESAPGHQIGHPCPPPGWTWWPVGCCAEGWRNGRTLVRGRCGAGTRHRGNRACPVVATTPPHRAGRHVQRAGSFVAQGAASDRGRVSSGSPEVPHVPNWGRPYSIGPWPRTRQPEEAFLPWPVGGKGGVPRHATVTPFGRVGWRVLVQGGHRNNEGRVTRRGRGSGPGGIPARKNPADRIRKVHRMKPAA
jgi:hypothetical protein